MLEGQTIRTFTHNLEGLASDPNCQHSSSIILRQGFLEFRREPSEPMGSSDSNDTVSARGQVVVSRYFEGGRVSRGNLWVTVRVESKDRRL